MLLTDVKLYHLETQAANELFYFIKVLCRTIKLVLSYCCYGMLYDLIKYIKQESRENTSLCHTCHLAVLIKYYVEMSSLPTITVQYTFNKTVSIHINRNVNKQFVIKTYATNNRTVFVYLGYVY